MTPATWRRLLLGLAVIGLAAAGVPFLLGQGDQLSPLSTQLGRSEIRIVSEAYRPPVGRTVAEVGLEARLLEQGYERVRGRRPERPGEFFWGFEVFWIYRRAYWSGGRQLPPELVGLALERPSGRILGPAASDGTLAEGKVPTLEPVVLAETLEGRRAPRIPVRFDAVPESVWRPLVAIEDARFFEHSGVDARGVARALLANAKKGGVTQGGSTITQQLIKMRELTPKRTLGRKASEALRALSLEADHTKEEILESYLNHLYYGHIDGVSIYGIGAAADAFFSKDVDELRLAEAALLAGIIQSPNRLSPVRNPTAAKERRNLVLQRMSELEWADPKAVEAAKERPLGLRTRVPRVRSAGSFLGWVAQRVQEEAPRRLKKGRGVVVETTLDPHLQRQAEKAVADRLRRIRRDYRRLRTDKLSAALVALDAETGDVLAYVGGDPAKASGSFDRARSARRQPGSTVKPLVLLEAFDECGGRRPLHAASRVADEPLEIDLEPGSWKPTNYDNRFKGVIDLRTAIVESRNVPLVRVARHCGFQATAEHLSRAGLTLPENPPPSFVLGAVEATPLEMASAYTVFATPGRIFEPRPVRRIERPGGRDLERFRVRSRRAVRPSSAYLVHNLLRDAVESGTGEGAKIEGLDVFGKTGTSSEKRDAWFAGQAGSVVTVVWVGLDDNGRLGLTGASAALPIWRQFMAAAALSRSPVSDTAPPRDIVEKIIHPKTGLLVRGWNPKGQPELFRSGALPPRDRIFRADAAIPVVR